MELATIIISCLALLISGVTAWLTLFHKGVVKMTRPTVFFFGPDGKMSKDPKVFLRTLLFCTSARGRIVESMYLRLRRNETSQIFNVWAYGDTELKRGSGLYVGKEGVVCNHHFLLPKDGTKFTFLPGEYRVEVYAQLTEEKNPKLLSTETLVIDDVWSEKITKMNAGVYFDWGPDSKKYHGFLDRDSTAELNYSLQKANKAVKNDK